MPAAALRGSARPSIGPAAKVIFNAIFWPYLLASSAAYFWIALALRALGIADERRRVLRRFTNWWAAHYLEWSPFAGCVVEGRHRVPRGPCVFVSNHQSMADVLAVASIRLDFLWVSKIENFYAPFIGWNMFLCGDVSLRRGNLASIRRMVRTCDDRLRRGFSLFVFPEGTRSPNGEIRSFHRGAFWLAARNRVPVVPILLEGTNHVLPKRSLAITPTSCLARVLDPVHPADHAHDSRKLRDAVRAILVEEQARVRSCG